MNTFFEFKSTIFRFGSFELQPQEQRLITHGGEIILGARALDLLLMLIKNAGKLVTKEQIFATLWPNVVVEENNLHVQISMLRKILGANAIATVSGKGYRFMADVTEVISEPVTKKITAGVKFLLIDDHALIRDALRGVMNELVSDGQLLEAGSVHAARELIRKNADIELITLDLYLPDACGFELLKEIRELHPQIPVVVISAQTEPKNVLAALNEGVQGFIPKTTTRSVMMQAFKLIFSGGVYIPAEVLAG